MMSDQEQREPTTAVLTFEDGSTETLVPVRQDEADENGLTVYEVATDFGDRWLAKVDLDVLPARSSLQVTNTGGTDG